MDQKKSLMKTVLVRSGGRIVVPKKIADTVGILEGTVLTFEDSKSKFSKKVVVQPSGRVVIPLEIRESFDIGDGTPLFLIVPANGSIMTVKTVNGEIFHIAIS